jgi:hypothetical protein
MLRVIPHPFPQTMLNGEPSDPSQPIIQAQLLCWRQPEPTPLLPQTVTPIARRVLIFFLPTSA